MANSEMFAMVLRLGAVAGVLGWRMVAPEPVNAGACFICSERGQGFCMEAHPAASGFWDCVEEQGGNGCIEGASCS